MTSRSPRMTWSSPRMTMVSVSRSLSAVLILSLVHKVYPQRPNLAYTTPTPFHPNKYPPFDSNSLEDSDFTYPDSGDDNVLYVSPDDYDVTYPDPDPMPNAQSYSDPEADERDRLFPERDRLFPEALGAATASELYRLLALGPQQADPAMMGNLRALEGLLGKSAAQNTAPSLDHIDHCPDRPEIGIQYYCMQLEDGLYHDPWNPWCGFIRCTDGVAERVCCETGSWLGMADTFRANQKALCRRALTSPVLDNKCSVPNPLDLCRAAKKVEKMNPPKKKESGPFPVRQEVGSDAPAHTPLHVSAADSMTSGHVDAGDLISMAGSRDFQK